MKTTYSTVVLGFGNHAAIEIPLNNLEEIGGNKRAPLKVTINEYTYQSTATGMDGKCLVVFPSRDRIASGVSSGDRVNVTLELDNGYRNVKIPPELNAALVLNNLSNIFYNLSYSKRKEFARQVTEAKAEETKKRRIAKIMDILNI
jgi:bifunctional DNA-binding transcriptional regulator/antitoxin component of YhaV-PrlF toxin-antitoxin module